jgi:hypothetical protein
MYEELLGDSEILPGEVYEKIYVGRTIEVDRMQLDGLIGGFDSYSYVELKDELMEIVFMERSLMGVKDS